MRYYTSELWKQANSQSSEERENAKRQWKINNDEYSKIFEYVKKRLPKAFLKIFMEEHGFHDCHLKNFEIIHGKAGYKDPVEVVITITNTEDTWNVIYKGIKEISVRYVSSPYIQPGKIRKYHDGFDEYGYNEFYEVDENILSHEILFASGATIFICFNKISINKVE